MLRICLGTALVLVGCKTEHPSDTSGFQVDAAVVPRDAGLRPDGRPAGRDASMTPRDAAAPGDGPAATDGRPAQDAAPQVVDLDMDGLDDALEARLAREYLPYLSLDPTDACPTLGVVFRARPHPADATLVNIIYVVLYNTDCGLGGHPGDDEAFGVTIDPAAPAPRGLVAVKAASHQGTLCERDTECGTCPGLMPCGLLPKNGVPTPVVYSAKDKHGNYALKNSCAFFATCLDTCTDSPMPTLPMLVNAGEPGAALVSNLSTQGFVTTPNGWTNMELHNYDPWGGMSFGGAGNVASDLADMAFVPTACRAP